MARVFLTGGSGLVGGALAGRLLERGDDLVALARSPSAADALSARGARVARGHVLDEQAMASAMAGCDLVFHVAGVNTHCPGDRRQMIRVNADGPETAVRAAARAGVPRMVLTSSAGTLGEAPGTVGREDTRHRGTYLSSYEKSKRDGELAAMGAARRLGVDLVRVNPGSVQGPGRSGGTGALLIAYLNGRLPLFVDTHLSLVDVRDCARGHVLAAERGRPGERYVLNGAVLTTMDALRLVSTLAGVSHPVRLVPPRVAMAGAALAEGVFRLLRRKPAVCRDMLRTYLHGHRFDGSRATRELGLAYTPVADTFRRTIEWGVATGRIHQPLPGLAASAGAPAV